MLIGHWWSRFGTIVLRATTKSIGTSEFESAMFGHTGAERTGA